MNDQAKTQAQLSAELAALRRRVAELEAREPEHRRAEQVQAALYRIADAASAVDDMQEFYAPVHRIVAELMVADNFFIALYDEARGMINFPYLVDEADLDVPDPRVWHKMGLGQARGITA